MEPISTLVVDDEPEARAGVLELLRSDPEVEVVGEASTGLEAVAAIGASRAELVFLDIQMPELDGFGVLARLAPEHTPVVVFVTAYDEYALEAFKVHALDYLLKPFSDARFTEALAHAKMKVRDRRIGQLGPGLTALLQYNAEQRGVPIPESETQISGAPSKDHLERMMVRTANGMSFVRVTEIDWIEARNYYAKLHVGGRDYLIRETMQRLAVKLDPRRFVRIHRSAIVNIDRIESLEPYYNGRYVVILRDRTRLTLSRSRRPALERALGQDIH
jgi:two-component system, LytTR family, response regulator